MRGKILWLSVSSEEDPEVRQKDALAKQRMKMYADKRANAKLSPVGNVIRCCCVKGTKKKRSTPFEGIPYTVFKRKEA